MNMHNCNHVKQILFDLSTLYSDYDILIKIKG